MKKFIIYILITITVSLFAFTLSAESNDPDTIVKEESCKVFLENEINKSINDIENENIIEKFILNCSNKIFKDNLSQKLIYTIIGETYEKAIDLSFLPVEFFINTEFENFNEDIDNIQDTTISETQTFNSISKLSETIITLLNIALLVLVSASIIIKVFKSQQGDAGRTNVKTLYRLIFAFGLLFPISGIAGYSFFQFILMIIISVSITLANLLAVVIFLFLSSVEVDENINTLQSNTFEEYILEIIKDEPINNTIYNNYSTLVNQSLCNIYQFNDTIGINISSPKQMKINLEKDDSYLTCLKTENPKNTNKNTTRFFKIIKDCANNVFNNKYYIYKTENEKTDAINISSINCQPYKENTSNQTILPEEEAFSFAFDIYNFNCKKFNIKNANTGVIKEFKCPNLKRVGKVIEPIIKEEEGVFVYDIISGDNISREENDVFFKNIKREIKILSKNNTLNYIMNNSEESSDRLNDLKNARDNKVEKVKKDLTNNLYNIIDKGWVGSFVFFNPTLISYSSLSSVWNDINFFIYEIFNDPKMIRQLAEKTLISSENNLPNDQWTTNIYSTQELDVNNKASVEPDESDESDESDEELNNEILKTNSLAIEALVNKEKYYDCIKNNECNSVIKFNIFKELNEKGKDLIKKGISIVASGTVVKNISFRPTLQKIADTVVYLGFVVIMGGIFLVIILPAIPFIIFAMFIITWIYSAFKILILTVINILSLFLESENSEDLINKNDNLEGNLIKSISNLFLTPIILTLSCFISMLVIFIMVNILYLTLFLVIETFSISIGSFDILSNIYLNVFYLITFFVLLLLIVVKGSLEMNNITQQIVSMLNVNVDQDDSDIINKFIENLKTKLFFK